MADLVEGHGVCFPSPLFLVKKEEMAEGRKAGRAIIDQNRPVPTHLAQALDPPLSICEQTAHNE